MKNIILFLSFIYVFNHKNFSNHVQKLDMKNNSNTDSCVNSQNVHLALMYLQWKLKTSKKLSKNHLVIFDSGYEMKTVDNHGDITIEFINKGVIEFTVSPQAGLVSTLGQNNPKTMSKYNAMFCKLMEYARFANLPQQYNYTYVDGNGNIWLINNDSIQYKPMTPERSSSGIYSGGEPFLHQISMEQFHEIEQLLNKCIYSSNVIENREMGTATVTKAIMANTIQQVFIKSNSVEKQNIESLLKALKN